MWGSLPQGKVINYVASCQKCVETRLYLCLNTLFGLLSTVLAVVDQFILFPLVPLSCSDSSYGKLMVCQAISSPLGSFSLWAA